MKLWELLAELPYVVSTKGDMNMTTHGKRWKTAVWR